MSPRAGPRRHHARNPARLGTRRGRPSVVIWLRPASQGSFPVTVVAAVSLYAELNRILWDFVWTRRVERNRPKPPVIRLRRHRWRRSAKAERCFPNIILPKCSWRSSARILAGSLRRCASEPPPGVAPHPAVAGWCWRHGALRFRLARARLNGSFVRAV